MFAKFEHLPIWGDFPITSADKEITPSSPILCTTFWRRVRTAIYGLFARWRDNMLRDLSHGTGTESSLTSLGSDPIVIGELCVF